MRVQEGDGLATPIGAKTLDPELLTAAESLQYEGFLRRQQTNRMVLQMAEDGTSIRHIVRLIGLSRGLIRQTVRCEREDVFRIRESRLTLGYRGWNGNG
mgnify:CR=1 FL=1